MLTIKRASNGYIVSLDQGDGVKELTLFTDSIQGVMDLARFIIDNTHGFGSRHDAERVYVINLPGDKYEGELTKEQRETAEWLSSVAKGASHE